MSVFLMIKVELPFDSIGQLNAQVVGDSTNPHEGVVNLRNQLESLLGGTKDGIVSIATRETTQAISSDGAGIIATYNLK